MDRRAFMRAGGALAAARYARGAACRPESFALTWLVDPASEESVAEARGAAAAGARIVAVGGSDIGMLWHTALAAAPGPIAGALRPSDCFVLERLAKSVGRTVVRRRALANTTSIPMVTFVALGPSGGQRKP